MTLSFSANLRYVRPIRHFINALCTLAEYGEEEAESIALVATEILNNSIEHGSAAETEEIDVTLDVTRQRFRLEVIDPGQGGKAFAEQALQLASRMPDLEEPRGRGLFLIRSYVDKLDISFDPQRGTRFLVVKERQP